MLKKIALAVAVLTVVGMVAVFTVIPGMAHKESLINRTLELNAGELYFQLKGQDKGAPITLKAGELVRLVIKNEGAILHDFHFGKDPDLTNRLYKTDMIPGFDMIELDKGQTVKLTLKVPSEPGEWELGCFQLGHYEGGQKAKIIIQK